MENGSNNFHLIIVAAGKGERAGGPVPKQYAQLGGRTVLRRTIEAFLPLPALASLRVVIAADHHSLYAQATDGLDLPSPIIGGQSRAESVRNGLDALQADANDIVLIHDAARPFIDSDDIRALLSAVGETGAATLGAPVADTLRRDDGHYVDRNGLFAIQTPQAFRLGMLRAALAAQDDLQATDESSIMTAQGVQVTLVPGKRSNFKITTPEDLAMAEALLTARTRFETRSGTGFDVHAFAAEDAEHIRICGLDIPHTRRLDGHSDADVGLHALTDALLGAMALGDIGQHFPPSDPQWKGASSDRFLRHAVDLVQKAGARIVNLDLTLICEAPKIGPHRTAMQAEIARICGLAPHRVSVKATTTERLGFTGRQEGIAAQAIANLELPYDPA